MFSDSHRQREKFRKTSIYLSDHDDPRLKKIIQEIAEDSGKSAKKITKQEIISYCNLHQISYIDFDEQGGFMRKVFSFFNRR
jgi:hypothetical protein